MRDRGFRVTVKNRSQLSHLQLRLKQIRTRLDFMAEKMTRISQKEYFDLCDIERISECHLLLSLFHEDDQLQYAQPLMEKIWSQNARNIKKKRY